MQRPTTTTRRALDTADSNEYRDPNKYVHTCMRLLSNKNFVQRSPLSLVEALGRYGTHPWDDDDDDDDDDGGRGQCNNGSAILAHPWTLVGK